MNKRMKRELVVEVGILMVAAWCLSAAFDVEFKRALAGLAAAVCISLLVMRLIRRPKSVSDGGMGLPVPTLLFEVKQPARDEWRA